MSDCKNCERMGKLNSLRELPKEITNHHTFKKKDLGLFLCAICDEYSLASALKAHEQRTQ